MMPVQEMFWGDRMGMIKDPYGHVWSIATHTENLTEEQMKERMQDFCASDCEVNHDYTYRYNC